MENKKMILMSLLLCIFLSLFGFTFAFFNFTKVTNEEVFDTGTIYMKLNSEENNITLTNVFPETQESADLKTNNYIDFTVKGLNTYNASIYYQINVINGSIPTGYTEDNRIDYSNIMLELTNLDTNTIISLNKYSELDNHKIYVKTIKDTIEVEHKYRLRMWIDENTLISDTDSNRDYCASSECDDSTKKIYNELFASIKVQVYGDLIEKHLYNVMGTLDSFSSYKSYIKEVYVLNESQNLIDASYNDATIKYDITNTDTTLGTTELQNMDDYGKVLAWLEPIDETYYKLYIASNGYTYLSTGLNLFFAYSNVETIDLSNAKTNFVNNMSGMFNTCNYLKKLNISNFDTSNVTNMYAMFRLCYSLTNLDLSSFNTSNVTNMGYMFNACSTLTTIIVSNKWNTSSITSSINMFEDCIKLVGGSGTTYNSSYIDVTYAIIDGGTSNPGYLTLKA